MPLDTERNLPSVGGKDDSYYEELEKSSSGIAINHTAFIEAQQDALSEGRPPWQIIRENLKTCAIIVVVQVSDHQLDLFQANYSRQCSSRQTV